MEIPLCFRADISRTPAPSSLIFRRWIQLDRIFPTRSKSSRSDYSSLRTNFAIILLLIPLCTRKSTSYLSQFCTYRLGLFDARFVSLIASFLSVMRPILPCGSEDMGFRDVRLFVSERYLKIPHASRSHFWTLNTTQSYLSNASKIVQIGPFVVENQLRQHFPSPSWFRSSPGSQPHISVSLSSF